MKQINPFAQDSTLFPYRWFIVIVVTVGAWMTYCDLTGRKMINFSNEQKWTASGPGAHK